MHMAARKSLRQVKAEADASAGAVGMTCPKCKSSSLPVQYTRPQPNGREWRVRMCRGCGHKVWTEEVIVCDVESRLPAVPKYDYPPDEV